MDILPYLVGVSLAMQPGQAANAEKKGDRRARLASPAGRGPVSRGKGTGRKDEESRSGGGSRARPSGVAGSGGPSGTPESGRPPARVEGSTGPAKAEASRPVARPDAKRPRAAGKRTTGDRGEDDDEDLEGKSDEEILKAFEKEAEAEPAAKKKKRAPSAKLQRIFQSLNPDVSAIGTVVFGYFYDHVLRGKGNVVPRGGHDPGKTGVHLQEVELALQAEVDPYFRFDAFLSFAQFGVELEEAYFTSLALPAKLQVRLGQVYHKFGRHNQQHLHSFEFVDNMIPVVRLLGGDNMRSLAGELSWLAPLPWYVNLSAAITQPDEDLTPSFVGTGVRKEGFHVKDVRHLLYVLRLDQFFALSDDWGLSFGVSYATGPNNSGGYHLNRTHLAGADLYLKWRPLHRPYLDMKLTVEGYVRYMQVPDDELLDWGGYAQMVWRLDKRWWLGFRYDMVQVGDPAKLIQWGFEETSSDPEHPRPVDDQHRGSVAVTYRATEFSQFRFQYNLDYVRRFGGTSGPFKPVHEVFVQVMGNIGTHGAHSY